MEKRKLLFVITEDWYFWTHRRGLALKARDDGYEVIVVSRESNYGDRIRKDGFKLIPLNMERGGCTPIVDLVSLWKLFGIYRNERPDIVHHVGLKPILYGSIAAIFSGVPGIVDAFAGLGYVFINKSAKSNILRFFLFNIFRVIMKCKRIRVVFQNKEDREAFVSKGIIDPSRACVIRGMGVDLRRFAFSEEPRETPVVMFVGRFLWDKGVDDLIRASELLRSRGLDFRMALVGWSDVDNPKSVPLKVLEDGEKRGLVELWGRHEDVHSMLAKSNLVVLPSYREGLPKVLLEASAVGRAIVATDVTGCREIVLSGENGVLVPPKDPFSLAESISVLLKDPQERGRMGRRGREVVEKEFSQDKVSMQTLALYEELWV